MLGDYIRITVDEPRGNEPSGMSGLRLQSGCAKEIVKKGGADKLIFVVSEFLLRGIVKVRVISVIEGSGGEVLGYIAAPDKEYVFDPELRQLLGNKVGREYRLNCLYEKSCGGIIFRRHSGNVEFLLIKNKKGGNWGFPKGHVEAGESEQDTAKREVFEETGLDINIIDGFRVTSEYRPRGRIYKQVVFFLAEMPEGGAVSVQQTEIDRSIWADYSLAMKTFRFNNDRNVLTKAKNWLSKN